MQNICRKRLKDFGCLKCR